MHENGLKINNANKQHARSMKNYFLLLLFIIPFLLKAQECHKNTAIKFQYELNEEYADEENSPLLEDDFKSFKALDFYPIDLDFCTQAKLVRTPNEKPFEMPTTTKRMARYKKYGELHFTLKGEEFKLNVYQNLDMIKIEQYKNALFLPFTDLTSGNGSYGGGRYIDLKIPKDDIIMLDFNTAYNPYCAYNPKYSCPIPPKENDLDIEIKAGVKEFLQVKH